MGQEKLTVTVSASLARFVEEYKRAHGLGAKSLVVERALEVLRERELEAANSEAPRDADPAWEATAADGLADGAW